MGWHVGMLFDRDVRMTNDTLAEVASLEGHAQAIHGELELGVQMTRYTLRRFGISTIEAEAIAEGLRGRSGRPWPLDPT